MTAPEHSVETRAGRAPDTAADSAGKDAGSAADAGDLDVDALRAQFPVLERRVHGDKPLVYLDSAASSQKPRCVIDTVREIYETQYSNVHRGVHTLSQELTGRYEHARAAVAAFVGAAGPTEVVFLRGATEAINLVANSFVRPRLEPGDEILITHMEHHANIVPWQLACQATGAELKVAPILDDGRLDTDAFADLLGDRTKFAAFSHVSNALGTVNPVGDLAALCRERGVPTLVDGAQAVPHMAVDFAGIGCDFYVFSGHKTCAPSGSGALIARAEHLRDMPPWQGGGEMILSVGLEKSSYKCGPARFEAGTPAIEANVALGVAVEWLDDIGMDRIAAREEHLRDYGTRVLEDVPGVRLIGTAPHKAAVLSFWMDGVHPHDLGTILDGEGVAVRAGHHCAQPTMQRFDVPATVRASLAFWNTEEELDALGAALVKAREVFGV